MSFFVAAFMVGLGLMTAVAVAPVLFLIVITLAKGALIVAMIIGGMWFVHRVTRRAE